MSSSFDDLLRAIPQRRDTRGREAAPGAAPRPAPAPTQIEKTTAAAKLILETEAMSRAEKTARLRAAREARDTGPRD